MSNQEPCEKCGRVIEPGMVCFEGSACPLVSMTYHTSLANRLRQIADEVEELEDRQNDWHD